VSRERSAVQPIPQDNDLVRAPSPAHMQNACHRSLILKRKVRIRQSQDAPRRGLRLG
jgi:hypothetical protein